MMEIEKKYGQIKKALYRYALTNTTAMGRPYIFLKEINNTLLLTTDPTEAKLFKATEEAQEYYTKYVLPNVLMGDSPLRILNSISLFILSVEFGQDYTLNKKGVK